MKRTIDKQSDLLKRIEQNTGVPSLAEKLNGELSSSDFNSLLTAVFALRTENAAPNALSELRRERT